MERPELRLSARPWALRTDEANLFELAPTLPNWRLADNGRRLVLDAIRQVTSQIPAPGDSGEPGSLDVQAAQQFAVIQLAAVGVRGAGSALVLISSGYGPEAGGPMRRLLECVSMSQMLLADTSGGRAREWLAGRFQKDLGVMMQKLAPHVDAGKIQLLTRDLNAVSHANARGLGAIATFDAEGNVSELELRPQVREDESAVMLAMLADACADLLGVVGEACRVDLLVPAWFEAEMMRVNEIVNDRYAETTSEDRRP